MTSLMCDLYSNNTSLIPGKSCLFVTTLQRPALKVGQKQVLQP